MLEQQIAQERAALAADRNSHGWHHIVRKARLIELERSTQAAKAAKEAREAAIQPKPKAPPPAFRSAFVMQKPGIPSSGAPLLPPSAPVQAEPASSSNSAAPSPGKEPAQSSEPDDANLSDQAGIDETARMVGSSSVADASEQGEARLRSRSIRRAEPRDYRRVRDHRDDRGYSRRQSCPPRQRSHSRTRRSGSRSRRCGSGSRRRDSNPRRLCSASRRRYGGRHKDRREDDVDASSAESGDRGCQARNKDERRRPDQQKAKQRSGPIAASSSSSESEDGAGSRSSSKARDAQGGWDKASAQLRKSQAQASQQPTQQALTDAPRGLAETSADALRALTSMGLGQMGIDKLREMRPEDFGQLMAMQQLVSAPTGTVPELPGVTLDRHALDKLAELQPDERENLCKEFIVYNAHKGIRNPSGWIFGKARTKVLQRMMAARAATY